MDSEDTEAEQAISRTENNESESPSAPLSGIEPLTLETIWFYQTLMEEALSSFMQLSLESQEKTAAQNTTSALSQETVWFQQQSFEEAEALAEMIRTGTANTNNNHISGKQSLSPEEIKRKKTLNRQEQTWKVRVFSDMATVTRTVQRIQEYVDTFEKTTQSREESIQNTITRISKALDMCKEHLQEEFSRKNAHVEQFKSVLTVVDASMESISEMLESEGTGSFKSHFSFCQATSSRFAQLEKDLDKSFKLLSLYHEDLSGSYVQHVIKTIEKLSFLKKADADTQISSSLDHVSKKAEEVFACTVNSRKGSETSESCSSSEESLEGSGSLSLEDSDIETEAKKEKTSVRTQKTDSESKPSVGKNKGSARPKQPSGSENAKTIPPLANKKGNQKGKKKNDYPLSTASGKGVFRFQGNSTNSQFLHSQMPGLLGRRPDLLQAQRKNQHGGAVAFSSGHQQQQKMRQKNSLPGHHSGLQNMNFNFASHSQQSNPFLKSAAAQMQNAGRGSSSFSPVTSTSQVKQSKLFQMHQKQVAQQQLGGLPSQHGLGFSLPQNASSPGLFHQSQPDMPGSSVMQGLGGNLDQQLKEMSRQIQQMQLATSQNLQLQHLMSETDRLRQLVAQNQHLHQARDRFQQQFQGLLHAVTQQQQKQRFLEQSILFQASQKGLQQVQRQDQAYTTNRHQQQKKMKQQQNKSHQTQQAHERQAQKDLSKQGSPSKRLKHENGTFTEVQPGASCSGEEVLKGKQKCPGPSKNYPCRSCKVSRVSMFSPLAQGDKHRAGVSSMVVLEKLGCLLVVDIINSCLKLYDISRDSKTATSLTHRLITRLDLAKPYYMARLTSESVAVSRDDQKISIIKVSKRRLELLYDLETKSQYYGLASVEDGIVACAAFASKRIDMVATQDGHLESGTMSEQVEGPELLSLLPSDSLIMFLERSSQQSMRLSSMTVEGEKQFSVDLGSSATDVWNVACIADKIVCCSKQTSRLKLYSKAGKYLCDLPCPRDVICQPFAMAFSECGNLYVANDGGWDKDYEHYITTEINVLAFS